MNFYLLDAAAPGLIFGVMIIFMLVTIVLEAVTMIIMKYSKAGKAFLDSFIVNLVSMGAGFTLLFIDTGLDLLDNEFANLLMLFAITVAVEFGILYLLNRSKPVKKTLIAAIVMNVVSYLLYYIISLW